MKYHVQFQQMGQNGRPIDHPSASDFETDGLGVVPNVGDYVELVTDDPDAPRYSGRVKSRLFRYFNNQTCAINLVVEDTKDDWGAVIKE